MGECWSLVLEWFDDWVLFRFSAELRLLLLTRGLLLLLLLEMVDIGTLAEMLWPAAFTPLSPRVRPFAKPCIA